jgi:membrane-associated phospholipid phosphatase
MNADIIFIIWLSEYKFFESFFQIVSTRLFSFSLLFLFSIYFFFKKKFWVFVFIILALLISDFLGAFLKDILSEERPCFGANGEFLISEGILESLCGNQKTGMPSNHALNFFLFTSLFYLIERNLLITLFLVLISILVSLSRVFLVKHFLSQVIIGAALGLIFGILFYEIYKRIIKKWTSQ